MLINTYQQKKFCWKLNTSHPGKFEEFKSFFAEYGGCVEATHFDIKEIDADPIQVVAHKASQLGEEIIVDDTSLDIEGTSIGINIRWLLDHLPDYAGRRAKWTALLAFHRKKEVFIYEGSVIGKIVLPRGAAGYGFDPVFVPDGSTQTLAESKPNVFNARAKAIEALIKGHVYTIHPLIENWTGPWQKGH